MLYSAFVSRAVLVVTFSLFAFFAAPFLVSAATEVSGPIDTNTTWTKANGPYVVTGLVTVEKGVTLTIKPGAVVKVQQAGGGFYNGLTVKGKLNATGTATARISFTAYTDDSVGGDTNGDGSGTSPAPGYWTEIRVASKGIANLRYANVRYAGSTSEDGKSNGLRNDGGTLLFENGTLEYNENYSLYHSGGTSTVASSKVRNHNIAISVQNPFVSVTGSEFSGNQQVFDIGPGGNAWISESGNTIVDGQRGYISIPGANITSDTTWQGSSFPYVISGTVVVNQGATLTMNPGVIIKGRINNSLFMIQGTLLALGTAEAPIIFTAANDDAAGGDTDGDGGIPEAGYWKGIRVEPTGTARFDHTAVRYAGGYEYAYTEFSNLINQGGTLEFTNSETSFASQNGIKHNAGTTTVAGSNLAHTPVGVYITAPFVSVTDSVFDTTPTAISVAGGDYSSDIFTASGNTYVGNQVPIIEISSMNVVGNVTWGSSFPYVISGTVVVNQGATLTMNPGVIIKGRINNSLFMIQGTLLALGTAEAPIIFTAANDDAAGGDTDGDGGIPEAGYWKGIRVEPTGTARFDHTAVRYAGGYEYAYTEFSNLINQGGTLEFTNSETSFASQNGIKHNAGTTTVAGSNLTNNGAYGIESSLFSSNIDARNNWWGSPSGPYHATKNPDGTGNGISGRVSFQPWAMAPFDIGLSCVVGTKGCYSNVLFLPGIMGSNLYQSDEEKCWLQDMNHVGDTDYDCVRMSSADTPNTSGLRTKNLVSYDGLAAPYQAIEDAMKGWQTELGIAAITTPYDWRYDFDHTVRSGTVEGNGYISYEDTVSKGYIEKELRALAANSKTGKVTVVAHSMGGLVAKELFSKIGSSETARLVDKFILIASPQLGTPKAVAALLHGTDMALGSIFWTLVTDAQARGLSHDMQSAYNLLPSQEYLDSLERDGNGVPYDPAVRFSNENGYFDRMIGDYGDNIVDRTKLAGFMSDGQWSGTSFNDTKTPWQAIRTMSDDAEVTHSALDSWKPPKGVKFTTLAGWGMDTISTLQYAEHEEDNEEVIEMSPQHVVDGDETVVTGSALYSSNRSDVERYWLDLPSAGGQTHSKIFDVPSLRTFIHNKITGEPVNSLDYIYTSRPSDSQIKRLHFVLHSPLTLGFRDDQGRYTGKTIDGKVKLEIPGSQYERYGEVQWLSLPVQTIGQLELVGTADGKFTLEVREKQGNTLKKQIDFERIASRKDTFVRMRFDGKSGPVVTDDLKLEIDLDHNGEFQSIGAN